MNRLLLALGAVAAGALLVPDDAMAQRGRGYGGGGFRGGGFHGGIGGPRGYAPGRAIGVRPGGYRPAAIGYPGVGRYGVRAPGYYGRVYGGAYRPYSRGYYGPGWRSPYYGGYYRGRYPYYGGAVAAGVIGGLALGSLTYPYSYGYPYDQGYSYDYGYYGDGVPYIGAMEEPNCWQGPPVCTAAGYPNMGYIRRQWGAPF